MSVLFDRRAVVTFGVRGQPGKRLEGLRVKFSIEKSDESYPNKASISIYNLNPSSRAEVEKKGLALVLSVGYGLELEDIFNGDIARPITVLEGPDYVTTFEVGDGEKAFQSSRVDVTYKEGTSMKDIFQGLATSLGQTIKDFSQIGPEKILNGLSLSGLSRSHLDELTAKSGLEWSIQDNALQVIKKGGSTNEQAVLLSPESGLIGIPKKKAEGIEFSSLLMPSIRPGRKVMLQSKFISGVFRCEKVTHKGDTHENDWFTTVEAVPL
jgi:hypothetical protein